MKYNILLKIVKILSDGRFYTYKSICKSIGIEKNYISKEINILRTFGLNICQVFNQGYKLNKPIQMIKKNKISLQILKKNTIFIVPIVDSTNQYLINRINKLKSGDICISEYQEKGRGRNDKSWFSPFGYNLCFSLYWILNFGLKAIMGLSLVVAISIAESLKKLGVPDIKLKWPNDVYINNKKLAGILIETIQSTIFKTKIIIGIGINLSKQYIYEKYISLEEVQCNIDRNVIFSILIKNLQISLLNFELHGLQPFIKKFLNLDIYLNRHVKLIFQDKKISGIYRGIDNQGSLLLEKNNVLTSCNIGNLSLYAN